MSQDRMDSELASYSTFFLDFMSESDRAAAILGAAKIDELLLRILTAALKPNPGTQDELLDPEAPIGAFGARINLTHRLGLIDEGLARQLHLIRKTRNAFAHQPGTTSLDQSPHRERVSEIVAASGKRGRIEELAKSSAEKYGIRLSVPSLEFRVAVSLTGALLIGTAGSNKSLYWREPVGPLSRAEQKRTES